MKTHEFLWTGPNTLISQTVQFLIIDIICLSIFYRLPPQQVPVSDSIVPSTRSTVSFWLYFLFISLDIVLLLVPIQWRRKLYGMGYPST
jgi:hypothetical protein